MHERHDRHCGELFGAGSEAEICLRIDFRERAKVADAVAVFESSAAIFNDEDGQAGRFVVRERRKNPIDLSRDIIVASGHLRPRKANRKKQSQGEAGVIAQEPFSPERSIPSDTGPDIPAHVLDLPDGKRPSTHR
jgi:hypothetical protein